MFNSLNRMFIFRFVPGVKFLIIVLFVLNCVINFSLIIVFSFEFIKTLQLKHLDLIVSSKNLFSRYDIKKKLFSGSSSNIFKIEFDEFLLRFSAPSKKKFSAYYLLMTC